MEPSIAASSSAPSPRRPGAAYSGPPHASPAASTRAGKSPVWPGFSSHPQVTWPNAERGVPAAPPALLACSPPGRRTPWAGFSPSSWLRFPADGGSRGTGRPVQPVARVSLACSVGNVSPGCNCSWLLVSGAGVQWPRCESNKNAVFPTLLR